MVAGAITQVLPPSVLYCHSYDERVPADLATSLTVPDTAPGLASKARGARTGTFLTATPALSMIEAPFSTLASATAWISARSCCRIATSAVCFSLRVVTAPLMRDWAAVSAACSSWMACVTAASVDTVAGDSGVPVMALTTPVAYAARATGCLGSFRETRERWDVLMAVMEPFRSRLESEGSRREDGLVAQADVLFRLEERLVRE